MSDFVETLKREFLDRAYRRAYSTEFVDARIATQIRVLREQRGWTQVVLAEKAGMKQSEVSRLENVNYSSWSAKTLRKIANAFDVVLDIRFDSFASHIHDIERFDRKTLQVPSFGYEGLTSEDTTTATRSPGARRAWISWSSTSPITIKNVTFDDADLKLSLNLYTEAGTGENLPIYDRRVSSGAGVLVSRTKDAIT